MARRLSAAAAGVEALPPQRRRLGSLGLGVEAAPASPAARLAGLRLMLEVQPPARRRGPRLQWV